MMNDLIVSDFGNILNPNNTMTWSVTSISNGLIPQASGGDVEPLLV